MNLRLTVFIVLYCITVAGTVGAEFPPSVNIAFEIMAEKGYTPTALSSSQILEIEGVTKSERLGRSGVEMYEVNRAIPGLTDLMPDPNSIPGFGNGTGVAEYFEVLSMEVEGVTMQFARGVPPEEIGRRKVAAGHITPEEFADGLDAYSDSLLAVGAALREEMPFLRGLGGKARPVDDKPDSDAPTVMQTLGMSMSVRDACGAMARGDEFYTTAYGTTGRTQTHVESASNSWLSPDPLTFLTGPACALKYTAAVLRAPDLTDEQKKAEIAQARDETNKRIQLAGRENVDGRPAYHLQMTDLGLSQTDQDGIRYDFERASVWIDEEYFVRRKMRYEGEMHAKGQSRDFFMEIVDQDYRNVPDSHLYEPYRTVMRVGGMTTPEQERELQAAMVQLEEYEKQMASLPASQRAMVERMMGDKINQARSLAQGGAVEIEMITTSIVINPDLGSAQLFVNDSDLIRTIQRDLTTLGYEPGPVNGQMSDQTASAIRGFESNQGMEVTGKATPGIAAALRAALR